MVLIHPNNANIQRVATVWLSQKICAIDAPLLLPNGYESRLYLAKFSSLALYSNLAKYLVAN